MITAEDIRSHYRKGVGAEASARALEQPAFSRELTPSAKFVTGLAKKKLGQSAVAGGRSNYAEEDLIGLVQTIEANEGEELSDHERNKVVAALAASMDHYDILSPLIENPTVNDIIIRSYNDISVQSERRNIKTDLSFVDEQSYKAFVENLLKRAGKACTMATPVVDAAIDPHVRACVTHESFSPAGSGPMLTLRIARHRTVSLEQLVRHELAPAEILEYLGALIEDGSNTILIGGEVGTGKTTLVKALALRIPEDEALLIIEDTHEVVLTRPFVRTLLTREANTEGAGRIAPAEAIRTGMRMAMNRVILGEMRDAEAAEAFIDVCSSGHSGLSTIHARCARDTLARLELFLARAQGNIGIENIRRQIANAVSVVVYLGLDKELGKRRIMEVLEVGTSTDGAVQASPMYSFRQRSGFPEWLREAGITAHRDLLMKRGVALSQPGAAIELSAEDLFRSGR